jgi:hypothetical protein
VTIDLASFLIGLGTGLLPLPVILGIGAAQTRRKRRAGNDALLRGLVEQAARPPEPGPKR